MNKEQYLLVKLMEEAAEVQQAASKALRFGLENTDPVTGITNVDYLVSEIGDLYVAMNALESHAGISLYITNSILDAKLKKLEKFMRISAELGVIK